MCGKPNTQNMYMYALTGCSSKMYVIQFATLSVVSIEAFFFGMWNNSLHKTMSAHFCLSSSPTRNKNDCQLVLEIHNA